MEGERRLGLPVSLHRLGPAARALLTFVALADAALSLELMALHHPVARLVLTTVLAVLAPVAPLAAALMVAVSLYTATRPKRAFRRLLVVLAVVALALSTRAGNPGLFAAALLVVLAALLAGSLWPEEGDPAASRLGWSLLGGAAVLGAIAGLVLLSPHPPTLPHPPRLAAHAVPPAFMLPLSLAFASAVAGLALLDRNPALPATWDPARALPLYRELARSGVAPFGLMRDKRHVWASDRRAVLAVGCRTGVALALGPAVGEPGAAALLHREFRAGCLAKGWRPAFYQVPEEMAADLPRSRRLLVGSEALVELDRFSLRGRTMANLRHQVTKARRLGVTVEVVAEAAAPWSALAAMRRLATETATRSRLGEMSFSVGHRDDPAPALVDRIAALAFDGEGGLVAYVTWILLPAAETIVLDEVKRSPQAPSGAVELLLARSLEELRGRARRASLGLAPITGVSHIASLASLERFLRRLLRAGGVSPGLYAFKAKFDPTWEPRYLVFERPSDLPPVLVALLLLHYPDAIRHWAWGRRALPDPR